MNTEKTSIEEVVETSKVYKKPNEYHYTESDYVTSAHARIAELEQEVQAYKKHGLEPCDYAGIVVSDNRAKKAQDDLSVLMKECMRLKSHNKEVMELLEAALLDRQEGCHNCVYRLLPNQNCLDKDSIWCVNWKWKHADRYEALKAQPNNINGGQLWNRYTLVAKGG